MTALGRRMDRQAKPPHIPESAANILRATEDFTANISFYEDEVYSSQLRYSLE